MTTASAKAGATATETELRDYARDHLAHFKWPQKIHFVFVVRHSFVIRASAFEACPSRQARDFEAVTGLTM